VTSLITSSVRISDEKAAGIGIMSPYPPEAWGSPFMNFKVTLAVRCSVVAIVGQRGQTSPRLRRRDSDR
jgi:hypothetical protein